LSHKNRDNVDIPSGKVSLIEKFGMLSLVPVLGLSLSFAALASLGFEIRYVEGWFGTMTSTLVTLGYLLRTKTRR